jgi:triosephosphate isomerase (TIM)
MASRQPLVAANWKMNGTLASIGSLLDDIKKGLTDDDTTVVICAPCIYIAEIQARLEGSRIKVGAQNVSQYDSGAHTGEIAVSMLQDYGCEYIIVGHSERRNLYHETDLMVAEKFVRVRAADIVPILCLGELLQERQAGTTQEVIARQLNEVIRLAGIEQFAKAVIAYEPVWAIGTGHTASPEQAEEVHAFIRLQLARHDDEIADNIKILYGGSVKADNARELFSRADIDGGLIGGASLNAQEFLTICQSTR